MSADGGQAQKSIKRHHRQKYRYREPLILCGHGIHIRIDHNTLLVRDGFTHYPQKAEKFRFFPGEANLPDRIIILGNSGSITFDAIDWMAEQKITFLQLDWQGDVTALGGSSGYCANPAAVDAQRRAIEGPNRIKLGRWLISEKIDQSISTLKAIFPKSESRESAISRIDNYRSKLINPRNRISISQLLGIEGPAAAAYFGAWNGLLLKWKGIGKRPIPENWGQIVPRTMAWRKSSRAARHPINAMLNYGYGILKHRVQAEVTAAGQDPRIGIIHGNSQNAIPLVYDLMEPLRPIIDRQVLEFAFSQTFEPGDFTISKWGGCRLNPQLAKVIVEKVSRLECASVIGAYLGQR
jgi:CRISPR-associated endonuclease Cas1